MYTLDRRMKVKVAFRRWRSVSALLVVSAVVLASCASTHSTSPASKVKQPMFVGLDTTTTGGASFIGVPVEQGYELAFANIDRGGGLLGHKIELVARDDGGSITAAISNVKSMITTNKIVALFGPDNSAVAAAEIPVVKANSNLAFISASANDVALTTTDLTNRTILATPNTVMEPTAAAMYVAKHLSGLGTIRLALIAPDYNFGLSSIASFQRALSALGVHYTVVAKELPSPTATSFVQYLPELETTRPNLIFSVLFGGQLATFTKEAASVSLLTHTHVLSYYGAAEVAALPATVRGPNLIGLNRAPFWALSGKGASQVISQWHRKYGTWPSEWGLEAYAAAQVWAEGVHRAGSFDAKKVVAALLGRSAQSILGSYLIKGCDHQELLPDFVGPVSSAVSRKYGETIYSHTDTEVGVSGAVCP
jgi:branched-chain amino acid transport system substrate-binding protein